MEKRKKMVAMIAVIAIIITLIAPLLTFFIGVNNSNF